MTRREEVAKRLRAQPKELAQECFYEGSAYNIEPLLFEIVYEIICGSEEGLYDDIFTKTADLIDPTCHVTDEEVTHEPTLNALAVHVYRCDSCGWYFYMAEVCCHPKPFYCPMCGARIVCDERDNDEEYFFDC